MKLGHHHAKRFMPSITLSEIAPETSLYIYRDHEGQLTFMGVPVESMSLLAGFCNEYGLTSYNDVLDLVTKAEAALHGN